MPKQKLVTIGSLNVGSTFVINPFTNREGIVTNAFVTERGESVVAVEATMTLPGREGNEVKVIHPDVLVRV